VLTALAGAAIATSSLAIQWELLLLWIGGTAASVACILRRARQSGEPPRVRLLFDAPPTAKRVTTRPAATAAPRRRPQPTAPDNPPADQRPGAPTAPVRPDQRRREPIHPGITAADRRPGRSERPGNPAERTRAPIQPAEHTREPNEPGIFVTDQRRPHPNEPWTSVADYWLQSAGPHPAESESGQPHPRHPDAAGTDPRQRRAYDDERDTAPRSQRREPNP
jgi:hypothetical protein